MDTTSSDLARLGIEVMKSAKGKSNRVLAQTTIHQMLTIQSGKYGLGFRVEGPPANSLRGNTGQGVAIMTNAQGGMVLANEIIRAMTAEYNWPHGSNH